MQNNARSNVRQSQLEIGGRSSKLIVVDSTTYCKVKLCNDMYTRTDSINLVRR